jgi:hypothetical protein
VQRAVSLAMARLLGVHTDGTQPHQPRALLDARRITCSSAASHSSVMWQRDHRRAAKRVSEAFKPGRDLASDRRAPEVPARGSARSRRPAARVRGHGVAVPPLQRTAPAHQSRPNHREAPPHGHRRLWPAARPQRSAAVDRQSHEFDAHRGWSQGVVRSWERITALLAVGSNSRLGGSVGECLAPPGRPRAESRLGDGPGARDWTPRPATGGTGRGAQHDHDRGPGWLEAPDHRPSIAIFDDPHREHAVTQR